MFLKLVLEGLIKVLLDLVKRLVFLMRHGTLAAAFKMMYIKIYIQLKDIIIIGV